MTNDSNDLNAPPASPGCGAGCLTGLLVAIGVPVTVFCAILIGNSRNPQCGTPADAGGCEMGLGSGTLSAIVIGFIAGLVVWLVLGERTNRKR
jgi:hypothetical protein